MDSSANCGGDEHGWQNREKNRNEGRDKARTFEFREALRNSELVALDDLARMEAHNEQMLGLFEELARDDDHCVRRIAHLHTNAHARSSHQSKTTK